MFVAVVFPALGILAALTRPAHATAPRAQDPQHTVRIADSGVSRATREAVLRLLPSTLERLTGAFPGTPTRPFTIVLHADEASLGPADAHHLHPGTPGFALLGRDEVHILMNHVRGSPPDDLPTILAHEVTHVLLDQFAGPRADRVPRWLHEGLAQSLSGDTYLGAKEVDLVIPASFGRLHRLRDLSIDFPDDGYQRRIAYHQSFSFVEWLVRRKGMAIVREAILNATADDDFIGGYALATGVPLSLEYDRWIAWITNDSGAYWLYLFQNCFSYLMIIGFVLLALAAIRVFRREAAVRDKLERDEQRELVEAEAMAEAEAQAMAAAEARAEVTDQDS